MLAEANTVAKQQTESQADQLIRLFNSEFQTTEQTVLVNGQQAGFAEPVYLPASIAASQVQPFHRIIFAHGFARSALHEIAHWCVAGKVRRQFVDFRYWYAPDGRDTAQQAAFEQVEITPQAVEWLLSLCADIEFEISVDNLSGSEPPNRLAFTQQVLERALQRAADAWPPRAMRFAQRLCSFYQTKFPQVEDFQRFGAQMLEREQQRLEEQT